MVYWSAHGLRDLVRVVQDSQAPIDPPVYPPRAIRYIPAFEHYEMGDGSFDPAKVAEGATVADAAFSTDPIALGRTR